MNLPEAKALLSTAPLQPANPEQVALEGAEVEAMRQCLHELANVLTSLAMAGGLLCERLPGGELRRYAADLRQEGERGSALVCQLRRTLVASLDRAQGEADSGESVAEPFPGEFR